MFFSVENIFKKNRVLEMQEVLVNYFPGKDMFILLCIHTNYNLTQNCQLKLTLVAVKVEGRLSPCYKFAK